MQLSSPQKISQKNKIPPATIEILSQILPEYYWLENLDDLFFYTPSAPNENSNDNTTVKVKKRLNAINWQCNEPLEILGNLLGDFMDNESHQSFEFIFEKASKAQVQRLKEDQSKILETLKKDGLQYHRGGYIIKAENSSTQGLQKAGFLSIEALQKEVTKNGLLAIEIEIKRALENIETDPMASALYAANILEASCKVYLDHHALSYKETACTLPALWQQVVEHAKIRSKDMEKKNLNDLDPKDLKMIASGLYQVVEGTMNLRNKKGAAHGRSEANFQKINLKPRHACLVVNAASALAMYILKLRQKTS